MVEVGLSVEFAPFGAFRIKFAKDPKKGLNAGNTSWMTSMNFQTSFQRGSSLSSLLIRKEVLTMSTKMTCDSKAMISPASLRVDYILAPAPAL